MRKCGLTIASMPSARCWRCIDRVKKTVAIATIGSGRVPRPAKALSNCGAEGIRTPDLLIANQPL